MRSGHRGDVQAAGALQHPPTGTTACFPLSIFWLMRSPFPAAGQLEGMNHRGRADPAHPSFSPNPSSRAAWLAQTCLPLCSQLRQDECCIPRKSLSWVPKMGTRSQASLRAECTGEGKTKKAKEIKGEEHHFLDGAKVPERESKQLNLSLLPRPTGTPWGSYQRSTPRFADSQSTGSFTESIFSHQSRVRISSTALDLGKPDATERKAQKRGEK